MDYDPDSCAQPVLIQKTARPRALPIGQSKNARRGFFRMVREIWRAVKGYTADDVGRLKEGGIQQVEGKGKTAIAEAVATLAEAAERQANAEKLIAEAYAIKKKADADFLKDRTTVFCILADAISRIKQQGGPVKRPKRKCSTSLTKGSEKT